MTLLPKIILTTLVPVGAVASAGMLLLTRHPHPSAALTWLVIAMTLLVALTAALLLRSILMRPLERLMQAHAALQHGDLQARVRIEGDDELAQLGQSFNAMAQALQATELRFRAIFEAFPSPVTLHRLADGCCLDANPVFCTLFGLRREQVIGRSNQQLGLSIEASVEQLHTAALNQARALNGVELQVTNRQGQHVWVLFNSRVIELDGEDVALSVAIDISRQKETEQALRSANARLRIFNAMVESSGDAMLFCDGEGTFLDCNAAALAIFGCTRDQFIGRHPMHFSPPTQPDGADSASQARQLIGKALAGEPQRFLWLHQRADGTPFMADVTLSQIAGTHHEPHRFVGVLRDITEQQRAEQALRASEQRFRAIFEAFPSPITLTQLPSARYLDVNPAYCEISGFRREEVIGRSLPELGMPFIDLAPERMLQLQETGRLDQELVRTPDRWGNALWVLLSVRTIELDGERVVLSMTVDITRQVATEQQLRAANERLRETSAMIESANDAMLILDDSGVFRFCNPAAQHIFGRTREQVIGHSPLEFSPEYQADGMRSDARAQQIIAGALAGTPQRFLWQHFRPDGSAFLADVALSRLATDGGAGRLVSVMRDVTAQHHAEQALQESEARFRTVFESFPAPITLIDLDSRRYLDVNPAFCRATGLSREQAVSHTLSELGIASDTERNDAMKARLLADGGLDIDLSQAIGPDGRPRWVMFSSRLISIGGRPAAMSVSIDITRQKEVEQELQELNASLESRIDARTRELLEALDTLTRAQEELVRAEKLAALGSLVAGIAHELNTPIGNAVMMASTLADQQRDFARTLEQGLTRSALQNFTDTVAEGSDILLRNLRRAAELIASFKQVAVDQSSYQRRQFSLDEVVQEIALALSPSLRHADVTLQVEIEPGVLLDSYPGPLGQVLMNLINNAAVHAFGDRPQGRVVVSGRALAPDRVEISVSDNGCGIPAAVQDRIFDPFFTTRLGQGGSGLGLHITYNLVTSLLGGSIRVHSSVGSGTRFDIELPQHAPPPPAARVS